MAASWSKLKLCYENFGVKLYKFRSIHGFNLLHERSWHCVCPSLSYHRKSIITLRKPLLLPVNATGEVTTAHSRLSRWKCTEVNDEKRTAIGGKKDITSPLPTKYDSKFVETGWYEWWEKEGFFKPQHRRIKELQENDEFLEKFVMCLPPPNVTGKLHLGHALTNSIQDALIRWNRMHGRETLWIPGCDHAGIATQVVVEKKIWSEMGLSRHDIGKEQFVKEVWKWKEQRGHEIYEQMKKLGSSLDWSRACFTMDEHLSDSVRRAFVQMFDEGLIFRAQRMVHWCCHLKSTISDVEVESLDLPGQTKLRVPGYEKGITFGQMVTFGYPVKDSKEVLYVSTTRPETMLGDAAIAVHPSDDRYTHLHGNNVVHPVDGRILPIVCDEFIDVNIGTGAVKITPAHDHNDFSLAKRHALPLVNIMTETGCLKNVHKDFEGMKRFDARQKVIDALSDLGLLKEIKSHAMQLPCCSRSRDVIEPILKEQWFLDCKELNAKALEVVKTNELEIIPQFYEKSWADFLGSEKSAEWCLSRQLWWGHQIPAYRVKVKNNRDMNDSWVCGITEEEARKKAAKKLNIKGTELTLEQDPDVLDTWFSSGLFPYSPLGWPNDTPDFKAYYPISLMETGHDILFFWVARMVILGLHLTGQLPFKQVLLHGILRDSHGRKMSKSLGNVVDPMDVITGIPLQEMNQKIYQSNLDPIEIDKAIKGQSLDYPDGIPEIGADAMRFTLCSYYFKEQLFNFNMQHMISNKRFCNKIWQGYRFVASFLSESVEPLSLSQGTNLKLSLMDQWILSRLHKLVDETNSNFMTYDLQLVTRTLLNFWIQDFCDTYLESVKKSLKEDKENENTIQQILFTCLDTYLRCLAPLMPFLTEELYQRLPNHVSKAESICISKYPIIELLPGKRNKDLDAHISTVKSIATRIQSVSNLYNLKPKQLTVVISSLDDAMIKTLTDKSVSHMLMLLSKAHTVNISPELPTASGSAIMEELIPGLYLTFELKGLIDIEKEKQRCMQKIKKLKKKLIPLQKVYKRFQADDVLSKIQNVEKDIEEAEKQLKIL